MNNWFCDLFRSPSVLPERDKMLARVFGIFSEEIVRIWCRSGISIYEDLGRPRIYNNNDKGYSLDFTLKSKETGKSYVSEMKCWVEYQEYKFMTLRKVSQLDAMESPAFNLFLDIANKPGCYDVYVGNNKIKVCGSILVWGDVDDAGRKEIISNCNFSDILSIKNIIEDLVSTNNPEFFSFIDSRKKWCDELFIKLTNLGEMQRITTV